jgi:hypothetical protein
VAALQDIQPPPDLPSVIQQLAQQFATMVNSLLSTVDLTVVEVSRAAYVSVILVGVLLYFTHAERRLGKDMIKGGIILAILSEFIFPLISKL